MPTEKDLKYIPGEDIIFKIRPSFFILAAQLVPIILVVAALFYIFLVSGLNIWWVYVLVFLAGGFISLVMFFNWYFTIFSLTNKRVENRVGIFGSREEEIALEDIQAVDVEQTLWGAIFGVGTILIKAAGSNREVDFTNIARPKKIARMISDMSVGNSRK